MDATQFFRRILPALLMASSVTLLSAGVFNWALPDAIGQAAFATPTPDSGNPVLEMTPMPTHTPPPTPTPFASSSAIPFPTPTASTGDALPTRIVIPSLKIDLPIVEGNTDYPLCDVAQYLDGFSNPGQPGTTYLYAHARVGMFLPLLTASQQPDDGASIIGALVKVYTADLKLHLYQITVVKKHAEDLSLAYDLQPGEHRLIMQTSEGPHGTVPKLQVAASPIGIFEATAADALPTPHPLVCR
jgi:Sortase domain